MRYGYAGMSASWPRTLQQCGAALFVIAALAPWPALAAKSPVEHAPAAQSPAQNAATAQLLYGMWYSYPVGNPETDPIRHEFRHNAATGHDEIIVTRICSGDYRAVIARAVSPVEISGSTIRVLKSATDSEAGELNSVCRASVEAGVLNFTLSEDGDRLTITRPGANSDVIDLARQDTAGEAVIPPTFFGMWLMPVQYDGKTKLQIQLVFYKSADSNRGKVHQINTCSKGNDNLVSQVDSNISFTENEITILDTASHDAKNGDFLCRASITAGTLQYSLSANGSTMTLSKAGASPMTLTRDNSGLHW